MKKVMIFTTVLFLSVFLAESQEHAVEYENVRAIIQYDNFLKQLALGIDQNTELTLIMDRKENTRLAFEKHDNILQTLNSQELEAYKQQKQKLNADKDASRKQFFNNGIPLFYSTLDSLDDIKLSLFKKMVFLNSNQEAIVVFNELKNIIAKQQQIMSENKEYSDFINYQKESEKRLYADRVSHFKRQKFLQKAIVISFFTLLFLIFLLMLIAYWKIFKKANKKAIFVLIPIYNLLIFADIIRINRLIILFFLVLIIALQLFDFQILITFAILAVVLFLHSYIFFRLAAVFGKKSLFIIGLILFPFIFVPIIAFGKSKYIFESIDN